VGSRQEPWKKFLRVIVNNLPRYINKYPDTEKRIVSEFITIIKDFDAETTERRQNLSKKFLQFIESYYLTDLYYKLPFLWFAIQYFTYANIELSVELFRTGEFYRYLVKAFKGDKEEGWEGAFDLIKLVTPLTDKKWETIQKKCVELLDPLSQNDYQRLNIIYNDILNPKFNTFNQKQICQRINLSKKDATSFFKKLDSGWTFIFHFPAFDLKRIICHIELSPNYVITDIANFGDPSSQFLSASEIYRKVGSTTEFYCIFYSPIKDINLFKMFLDILLELGYLQSYSLNEVERIRLTTSYRSYKPSHTSEERKIKGKRRREGWSRPDGAQFNRILNKIGKSDVKDQVQPNLTYTSPEPNQRWFYKEHKLPDQVIKTFCSFQRYFEFSSLPTRNNSKGQRDLLNIMKEMIRKRVAYPFYISYRLLYSFSLKKYLVKVPKSSKIQSETLLELLPFCQLFYVKENIFLYTHLTSELKEFLRKNNWQPVGIERTHYPEPISFDWFDIDNLEWKSPRFSLKNKKKGI